MKPRDKAEELVRKMCLNDCTIKNIDKAKQFALIAIDEIMEALEKNGSWNYDYWEEVKQEINNL